MDAANAANTARDLRDFAVALKPRRQAVRREIVPSTPRCPSRREPDVRIDRVVQLVDRTRGSPLRLSDFPHR